MRQLIKRKLTGILKYTTNMSLTYMIVADKPVLLFSMKVLSFYLLRISDKNLNPVTWNRHFPATSVLL